MEQCFMRATQLFSGGLALSVSDLERNGSPLCTDIAVRLRH
jgi:hypothetical protein